MTTCDVLVVGGGIAGLWIAKKASDTGLKVTVVDKGPCGSGGSGGVLGALLPHLPNAMNEKNRFQFDALAELSQLTSALEDETGLSTGYARCGRLMPIRHESFYNTVELCQSKARDNWQHSVQNFQFKKLSPEDHSGWLDPERAPLGLAWDNLAAKVEPRKYLAALRKSIMEKNEVIEDFEVVSINQQTGEVQSRDGRSITAGTVVLAAGYQSYGLLESITGISFGMGVKGQAATFALPLEGQKPVLYDDGMYIVHHAPDRCAVGSTTEPDWVDEHHTDEKKTAKFLTKAMALCPPLRNAEFLGLWAGIRPKSSAKDPMVGKVSPDSRVYMATGGFKISFGIAHRLAEYVVSDLVQKQIKIALPKSYGIAHHIKCGVDMGRISNEQRDNLIR